MGYCSGAYISLEEADNRPKKGKVAIDVSVVQAYAAKVQDAKHDRVNALSIFAELSKDKRIRKAETQAILSILRERDTNIKGKTEGLKEIEAWIHRISDTERRLKQTDDLF